MTACNLGDTLTTLSIRSHLMTLSAVMDWGRLHIFIREDTVISVKRSDGESADRPSPSSFYLCSVQSQILRL